MSKQYTHARVSILKESGWVKVIDIPFQTENYQRGINRLADQLHNNKQLRFDFFDDISLTSIGLHNLQDQTFKVEAVYKGKHFLKDR